MNHNDAVNNLYHNAQDLLTAAGEILSCYPQSSTKELQTLETRVRALQAALNEDFTDDDDPAPSKPNPKIARVEAMANMLFAKVAGLYLNEGGPEVLKNPEGYISQCEVISKAVNVAAACHLRELDAFVERMTAPLLDDQTDTDPEA